MSKEAERILEHYVFRNEKSLFFSITPFGVGEEERKAG